MARLGKSILTLALAMLVAQPCEAQRRRVVLPPVPGEDGQTQPPAAPAEAAALDPALSAPVEAKPAPPPPEAKWLISALQAQNEAINLRLTHRLVRGKWRPEAMPSGAAGTNLFTDQDHAIGRYKRNRNLWAQDIAGDFSGVSIYNTHTVQSYGGILITPRHLLFCAHAHPHAAGTWHVNPERPDTVHHFVRHDGRLIKSTQLHQASSHGSTRQAGLASADLCVALLDRDLEAEGLHVVPIFPNVPDAARTAAREWAKSSGQPFAFLGVSQGVGRPTNRPPPNPIADYPRQHMRMLYIKDLNDMSNTATPRSPYADWNYQVWDGDSGSPAFLLLHGRPHLWMILTASPGGGPQVGAHIDHINALIDLADHNAIHFGRLERPTGYRLRVGTWPQGGKP